MSTQDATLQPRAAAVDPHVPGTAGVAAAVAGLLGAWIAAGSTGLLGHPLRRGLTCVALGCIVIAVCARSGSLRTRLGQVLAWAAALVAAAAMIASPLPPINALAVAVVLLAASYGQPDAPKKTLRASAAAVTVLALYRLAYLSIPLVWMSADRLGDLLGAAAGWLAGCPLWLGATLAGVDFLVPMLVLAVAVPLSARRGPGWLPLAGRILLAVGTVLAAHLLYLLLLASTEHLYVLLPDVRPGDLPGAVQADGGPLVDFLRAVRDACLPAAGRPWQGPALALGGLAHALLGWLPTLVRTLRDIVPWNLPLVAAGLQALVARDVFRRARRAEAVPVGEIGGASEGDSPVFAGAKTGTVPQAKTGTVPGARIATVPLLLFGAAVCLGAALPVVTTLCWHRPEVAGKKIVFYKEGFLNWLKPEHGDYGRNSIYMYGMLPRFLESLGAEVVVSPDLAEDDLADADALVLLYPDKPWQEGQLERIWRFVGRGGSLLVAADHTLCEKKDSGSRVNDVLEPTAMRVPFDSAMFTVGGWLQSYDALAHPTSAGVRDEQNDFGVVIGASVEARWPARPLLVGRWGYIDFGDMRNKESHMGDRRCNAGEKLGDVLLAAEQPFGEGKIVVFGDTSSFINGINMACYPYTSRLFAYLVDGPYTPQAAYREALGLLIVLLLAGLAVWRPDPWRLAGLAAALSASLAVCTAVTHDRWEILPDGTHQSPNKLAYVDAGHLNAYTRDEWRGDGATGLCMTLMRNGCLTLLAPDLKPERLERAGLLVCIAPEREYTVAERRAIRNFVRKGGTLIYTVGYERIEPSRRLLDDFGFRVGEVLPTDGQPPKEPEPLGHFKSPFFRGNDFLAHVRFHAAWEVECDGSKAKGVAFYPTQRPIIVVRGFGKGRVALIGDTGFALNKNLEREDGQPIEGLRENADFWRWFLAALAHTEPWYPSKPEAAAAGPTAPAPPQPGPAPPAAEERAP